MRPVSTHRRQLVASPDATVVSGAYALPLVLFLFCCFCSVYVTVKANVKQIVTLNKLILMLNQEKIITLNIITK